MGVFCGWTAQFDEEAFSILEDRLSAFNFGMNTELQDLTPRSQHLTTTLFRLIGRGMLACWICRDACWMRNVS